MSSGIPPAPPGYQRPYRRARGQLPGTIAPQDLGGGVVFTDGDPLERVCERQKCSKKYSTEEMEFQYVQGGTKYGPPTSRWLCAPCVEYYLDKMENNKREYDAVWAERKGDLSTEVKHSYLNVYTDREPRTSTEPMAKRPNLSAIPFEKASAAAQRAASHPDREAHVFPAQRMSNMPASSQKREMLPPADVPIRRNVAQVKKGYTGAHRQYEVQRDKVVAQITKPVASQIGQRQVNILFAMHFEKEGKSGTTLLWNIEEEREISVTMTRAQVRLKGLETVMPLFNKRACGFHLDTQTLIMYKSTKTPLDIDLDADPPRFPNDQCLTPFFYQPSDKAPQTPVFRANTKVKILFVMDAKLHDELSYHLLQFDGHDSSTPNTSKASSTRSTQKRSQWYKDQDLSRYRLEDEEREPQKEDGEPRETPAGERSAERCEVGQDIWGKSYNKRKQVDGLERNANEKSQTRAAGSSTLPISASSLAAQHGGSARYVNSESLSSVQPNVLSQDEVDSFLRGQERVNRMGNKLIRCSFEDMRILEIPSLDFRTILSMDRALKAANQGGFACITPDSKYVLAKVLVYYDQGVGTKGAFKTCHKAEILPMLSGSEEERTLQAMFGGSIANLVAKRAYKERVIDPKTYPPFRKVWGRYDDVKEELALMLPEASCACIGNALMREANVYVKEFCSRHPPPANLHIPSLRFVHTAFAIPAGTEGKAVLLLEEKIAGDFKRYVSNSHAKPFPGLSSDDHQIAEFLCFVQHFQFIYTNRQMYVSDFQGGDNLLTDCQIMTAPEHGDGFPDGNLGYAFNNFTQDHVCNKYCEYFQVKELDQRGRRNGSQNDEGDNEDARLVQAAEAMVMMGGGGAAQAGFGADQPARRRSNNGENARILGEARGTDPEVAGAAGGDQVHMDRDGEDSENVSINSGSDKENK
ncbi:hypothetical protein NM688_g61 [Phlebia brevispora]|uniref:Uncharacterized protein n=1 Tax=Phlebia brevispora TaxID=194682 RepID=A0ACC1TFE0_9APHY|nr:hypothetical protein NM688_g61 [Phlebia brevispora]